MQIDYSVSLISNNNGDLTLHYPRRIALLEYELGTKQNATASNSQSTTRGTDTIHESLQDAAKLRELFLKARAAR